MTSFKVFCVPCSARKVLSHSALTFVALAALTRACPGHPPGPEHSPEREAIHVVTGLESQNGGGAQLSVGVTRARPWPDPTIATAHRGWTDGLVYSRDGAMIAGWTSAGLVFVWDRNKGQPILELLITGMGDKVVTIWDLRRKSIAFSLGHGEVAVEGGPVVSSVAFSTNGRQLACGFYLKTAGNATRVLAIVVDIAEVAVRTFFVEKSGTKYMGAPIGLAFSSDDKTLAIGYLNGIALLDAVTTRLKRVLSAPGRVFYKCVVFLSPASPLLAAACQPVSVVVFDATTGQTVSILQGKERTEPRLEPIVAIAISPDRKRLAASTRGNEVALWELPSGKLLAQIQEGAGVGFRDTQCWLSFPPDGNSLLTASRGHERSRLFARRRDPSTGELTATVELLPPAGIDFDSLPFIRGFSPSGHELLGIGEPLEQNEAAHTRGEDSHREAFVTYDTRVLLKREGVRGKGAP